MKEIIIGNEKHYHESVVNQLKEELKRERDAVDFYANKKNYLDTCKSSKPNYRIVKLLDCDRAEYSTYGGRIARETQELRELNI